MKKLIPILLLLLSCQKTNNSLQKTDSDFHLKDTLLRVKEAQISVENKRAGERIVQTRQLVKLAEKKVLDNVMPTQIRADVDSLLRAEAEKDSSYQNKINWQDSAIVNRDSQIALLTGYSESLHMIAVAKDDSLQASKKEVLRLNAKIRRKNWKILGAFVMGIAGGRIIP